MSDQWLQWAKKIQAISQSGLAFSKDKYDIERYEELRDLSVEILTTYTDYEMEKIKKLFTNETGYQTPKVDVRAAIFKEEQLLLVEEKADGKWALPGGFCDIGLSPTENIIQEVKEESGFDVEAKQLIAVLDQEKHDHPPLAFHFYKIFIHCEIMGGQAMGGLETNRVKFFKQEHLPPLSLRRNTEAQIDMLFAYLQQSTNWKPIID